MMNEQLREIALRKEGQTYIFRFDAVSQRVLLGVLGRFATDPGLNFSWHDAAVVCKIARQPCPKSGPAVASPPSGGRLSVSGRAAA
jgi:hypothetical protein